MSKKTFLIVFPIILTILTFLGLTILLFAFIQALNTLPIKTKISMNLHPADVIIGLTIYLKTSIDFAIFIGNLMHKHPGVKNRVAIEIGTALGNGLGTLLILTVWTFFKEIPLLLALMIILAALVLFRMAQDSIDEFFETRKRLPALFMQTLSTIYIPLSFVNKIFNPVISRLLPHISAKEKVSTTFTGLLLFSFSVPFVLGLDDFAGYIPLFSIVNVFGFAVGTFLGHMLLNVSLFAAPSFTTKVVRQPLVMILGGLVFIFLALLGLYEAFHIFL